MRISISLLLHGFLIVSLGKPSSQKDNDVPRPKVWAYTWIGEIKAPKLPHSPSEDICLSMDPSTTEALIRDKQVVARKCEKVSPKWTTWRATGIMSEKASGAGVTFKGYIEHLELGYCITYSLFSRWDMGQSPRGWLLLKNCDALKELAKYMDVDTMEGMQDAEYDEFINIIRMPRDHEYDGLKLSEGSPDFSPLGRRIFLKSFQPTLRMGDNTNLITMNINDICGGYGPYKLALESAQRNGDEEFTLSNWSIMANYQPKDTCKKKVDGWNGDKYYECPDGWNFGCGFGTVNLEPKFGVFGKPGEEDET
ncbi:hypothetical protein TWF481_003987 [Arthrobotrys musiformis]|uniref:Uncharacterized protein n=1 Tax=Arthrobotrys musiformis TaxID=47236 RepID=A0AAV9WIC3_9PEZI